jgi:hypothetical protein
MALYGSAIALVSGGYSLFLATTGPDMTGSAWLMLALGLVVIVHGIALVTPYAAAIADVSGLLMIAYAVLMLLNQAWMTTMDGSGTGGMNGMDSMATGMGPDAGMVAIALLMLASGVIMHTNRDGM